MSTTWDLGEVLSEGWERVSAQLPVLVLMALIVFAINLVFSLLGAVTDVVSAAMEDDVITLVMSLISLLLSGASMLVGVWLSVGSTRIALDVARGEEASLGSLFNQLSAFPSALFAGLLSGLLILAGTCFFVVPGVIAALGFGLITPLIVDQRLGPIDALAESWRLMTDEMLQMLVLWVVFGAITLAGLALCGVPLLVILPLVQVVECVVYLRLVDAKGPKYAD